MAKRKVTKGQTTI